MTIALKNILLILSSIAVILSGFLLLKNKTPEPIFGSAVVGNDYVATTTAPNAVYGARTASSFLLKTGGGSIGSVIITGANTGVFNLYDATTTVLTSREAVKATSTIHIASFPASLAAGTYVLDAEFSDGLYFDLVSGIMPTTTITYR